MTATEIAALLGWGVLVGLDLVSLPQAMIARPLVAAPVAGAILGDFDAGLTVGLALELFQLDVLPVGASRYPEYGPAAIAGAAAAHLAPGVLGLGLAILAGL
ncbi:MAG: PTS sugar transporter subunit IIC, partial [Gemmatimonadales bacterium]